ncbi:VCBS domain-containing protein [Rhodococcus opacus]|nr:VCBS domain-containing protein [Rhodococcus opacus]
MPDSGTTAGESEQAGSSSDATAPTAIDASGAAIAPADRPQERADTELSDSPASPAPVQGHDSAPQGSDPAPTPPTTPVTGSSGAALDPIMAEDPAARGPVPNAPAAIQDAVPATASAPEITTIDGATALTGIASDTKADASQVVTQALAPSLPTAAVDVASSVVSKVLGALGLRPFLSNDPQVPIESPTFWALAAAWCRRQEKVFTADANPTLAAAPVTTSEPIESVAVTSTASTLTSTASTGTSSTSTAGPTVGAPDRSTGVVLGSINTSGDQLGYTVTGQPSRGTVTVDETGGFRYTPTQAARQVAALDPSADYTSFDSFTVTPTSGQTSTPVTVQVPVSAARMQVAQSTTVGSNPSGAVFTGTRTYVANQGSKSVSVLDTNDTVVGTVTVGTSPTGVAANPAGTRVYVTNSGSGNVSVIDTATNTVVATVKTGTTPSAVAVNPAGTRAYVTNSGSGTVSVINTATNTVVGSPIKVGITPNAVAVSPDGTRVYVTNRSSNTVSVINTATNTVVATIRTGTTPNAVAVNPTGTRAYVTNRANNTVSVIDTATNSVVTTVAVGSQPTAVRVSPDGSAAYVVSNPDRLTVIDARTNTVVSTLSIDSPTESGDHSIALSADGSRMLVTDATDGRVRAVTLTHVNSEPTMSWTADAPRPSDGAVVVTLVDPRDPDGDPLTFTNTAPGSGSVVSDGMTFTYTPTAAARDLALQTPGEDADHFTIALADGQAVTNIVVTVAISPTEVPDILEVESTTIAVGSGPTGVVTAEDRIYVVSDEGFVRVIDPETNTVVGAPIEVDWASSNIAATSTSVYVNSPYTGAISVIDTSTGTVVDTIWVDPAPDYQGYSLAQELAVSPDGTRLYASGEDGTVSVIDTATNTVIASQLLGSYSSLEVSADGRYLYGTSGATVSVIDTASLTRTAEITVGPEWDLTRTSSEFADVSHSVTVVNGNRLYVTHHVSTVERATGSFSNGQFITDSQGRLWRVTGGYGLVSVIDIDPASATYGSTLDTVRLTGDAQDLALSPDGGRAFVTAGDGRTIAVIDTATNTVVGTFVTDGEGAVTGPYGPLRTVSISSDTLYVTDYNDGAMYAVTGALDGAPAAVLT